MSNSAAGLASTLIGWIAGLFGGDDGSSTSPRTPLNAAIVEVARGDGPAWGALSGLAAHPTDASRLFAVTDDNAPPPRILELDVSGGGAHVARQINLELPGISGLDIEALAAKPDGGFWLASEGGDYDEPKNRLIEVDASGRLVRVIGLPPQIATRMLKQGFEGIAFVAGGGARGASAGGSNGDRLYVAFQGPIDGDDDAVARIANVDLATGEWRFWHYPLDFDKDGSPTGLSELMHISANRFGAIERDGKGGRKAIKWVTTFDLADAPGAPVGDTPPLLVKRVAVDLVPLFLDADRKVEKEVEGLTIATDGAVYALTDNDNDERRSTLLLRLGQVGDVFR